MPRVSVITGVYNAGRFLQQTIDSILKQTFTDLEYILVDDASVDDSVEIIRSTNDPRIRLFSNERNQGLVDTRNRGIAEARGDFIALTDHDDISLPNRLEDQVKFMDKNPDIGLLGTWASNIDEQGRPMNKRLLRRYSPEECRASLLFRNIFGNSTLMFRRTAIPSPPYAPEYPLCEDYHFIIQASRKSEIYVLPKTTVLFRVHAGSHGKRSEQQTSTLAKSLKRELLNEIGIAPTAQQLELHETIERVSSLALDLTLLSDTQAWLQKVIQANECSGIYNSESLSKVAGNEWFQVCLRTAARGLSTTTQFARSPLSRKSSYRQLAKLRLLYKSLSSKFHLQLKRWAKT